MKEITNSFERMVTTEMHVQNRYSLVSNFTDGDAQAEGLTLMTETWNEHFNMSRQINDQVYNSEL
jgi:hypothetical protein